MRNVLAVLLSFLIVYSTGLLSVQAASFEAAIPENETIAEGLIDKTNEFKKITQTSVFKKCVLGFGIVISCMASSDIGVQIIEIMRNRRK